MVGVSNVTIKGLISLDKAMWFLIGASRLPRTITIILTAIGLSISGLILQTITNNKFVSPDVVGVTDSAKLGLINENTKLVEPTSGNTGIGLAFVAAAKGIKLTLIMPDTMSKERMATMKALGAELILTEGKLGMKGAIALAEKMQSEDPNVIIPQQFQNPANPSIHKSTTAIEIYHDLEGDIQAFVSGVGTGGTFTGVGEYLKSKLDKVEIIAVEPFESQVLAGGTHSSHKIQGIGAGFIPAVMNLKVVDRIIPITSEEAIEMTRFIAKTEGIFVGISSGAALAAAIKVAKEDQYLNKNIVVVLPDSGDRYLSTGIFD